MNPLHALRASSVSDWLLSDARYWLIASATRRFSSSVRDRRKCSIIWPLSELGILTFNFHCEGVYAPMNLIISIPLSEPL